MYMQEAATAKVLDLFDGNAVPIAWLLYLELLYHSIQECSLVINVLPKAMLYLPYNIPWLLWVNIFQSFLERVSV
jgi:hypothetical protein